MNQGTGRIVIIVALVAVGVIVLANGFDGGGSAAGTPTGTGSPTPTQTLSPTVTTTPTSTPSPQTTGVLFMALNGTSATGLAAVVQEMLVAENYVAPQDAENAPTSGVQVTTVYYRGGDNAAQNQSDAQYVADTFFPDIDARVKELSDQYNEIVPNSATLVIVVGQDLADVSGN